MRYRRLETLGSGGTALVYLAEDTRLGRRVAVKQLHSAAPEDSARRLQREARLGASLSHPNLVSVFDVETDGDSVLVVMEFVDGPTLREELKRGPLSFDTAADVIAQVAAGLDHAHAAGVVHRDVKPANILLGRDGVVKLADLGIATAAQATRITLSGTVLGTAAYMAPEQVEGRQATPQSDIYALGAVAFEALSGRKAREGSSPMEIAHRIATEPPPELRDIWPAAPARAAEAIAQAMSVDPKQRQRRASELAADLAPDAPLLPEGRGRPLLAWLAPAAALAAAGAAVAIAVGAGGDGGPRREPAARPTTEVRTEVRTETQTVPVPRPAPAAAGPVSLNDQGFQLMTRGRYEEAIPLLRRAVAAADPGGVTYAYALYNLGRSLRLAGRAAEAIPVLEQRAKIKNQQKVVKRELKAAREGH